jgi:hypothetical protein
MKIGNGYLWFYEEKNPPAGLVVSGVSGMSIGHGSFGTATPEGSGPKNYGY